MYECLGLLSLIKIAVRLLTVRTVTQYLLRKLELHKLLCK